MLNIENVSKYYGAHCALKEVSLHVPKGSIFGLLGPNGAGKTSLIRIINQITAPDKGKVFINGEELKPSHISHIGYLPEERGLYPKMRVEEQVLYLARLKGLSKDIAQKRIKDWFERFDINSWRHKNVEELSKGMAQKVQFVATVIHQPRLLIFDEPFTGFDPINTNLIKSEILRLRDKGATIIFSTHRMDSVEEICDRIALIHKSQKILEGDLMNLKNEYKSNVFQVAMDVDSQQLTIPDYAKLLNSKKGHSSTVYRFSLQEKDSNLLLVELLNQGQIFSFHEELPSLNDIFIQNVQQQ